MASFLSAIPAPERTKEYIPPVAPAISSQLVLSGGASRALSTAASSFRVSQSVAELNAHIPPYGKRQGFMPRAAQDFGDGGAFPEVHILQYPLDMGRKDKTGGARVTSLQVDANGDVQYDAVLKQNLGNQVIMYSKYTDLVERNASSDELQRPDEEEQRRIAERTRAALEKKMDGRIKAAQPKALASDGSKRDEPTYVRYTPGQAQQDDSHNSGAKQRIIRMQEMPNDPLEPPKFKHKRLPGGPPDAPVPIMHSPPRKLSAADAANWKIPPCVSSWKNAKGYIIPLDKRLANDGRGLQENTVNDNFAKLAESLYVAEKKAREDIEARAKVRQQVSRKQQEQKELELRNLAAAARDKRSVVAVDEDREAEDDYEPAGVSEADLEAKDRRDQMRAELKREREREARLDRSKKAKVGQGRDEERDVSEAVALGKALPKSQESMFDTRLYNQSQGMSAGFGAEDDYSVYSKPFSAGSSATQLYRPTKGGADVDDSSSSDMGSLLETTGTARFKADKGFAGTELGRAELGGRSKPVEFEKSSGGDSFGIEQFLTEARSRSNALDSIGKSGHMTAAAGGSSADDLSNSGPRRGKMDFVSSSSSSSSSRDRR